MLENRDTIVDHPSGSLLLGLGGFAGSGGLTSGSLAKSLLLGGVVVLQELLETGHGHTVGGGSGLLTTGRRKSGGLLGDGSLGGLLTLGGNLLVGNLEDLLNSLTNISLLDGGLLGLGTTLGGSLGSGTTLDADTTNGSGLLGTGLALSISNILDGEGGGVTILEVEVVTLTTGDNTLGLDLTLGGVNLGNVGHINTLAGGESRLGAGVSEVLDNGLHLVVSVDVNGVAGRNDLLVKVGLEGVDDESNLEAGVGGEDGGGVDSSHLKGPVGDEDNVVLQIGNVDGWVLVSEFLNSGLGEVARHVEVGVGDEEVGVGLLDENLKQLLGKVLRELAGITTSLEHLVVKVLECGLGHDL